MKGMVFTEFIEFAEQQFGEDLVEDAIDAAGLESGGAYTAVGTYDHRELVRIIEQLTAKTGKQPGELLYSFGEALFHRFASMYGQFFEGVTSAFDFLSRIESYIHLEVRKLYPDAELPKFECARPDDDRLELTYRSERQLGDLAHGLIAGCIDYFNEPLHLSRQNLDQSGAGAVHFTVSRPAV